ncbi:MULTISPECIES: EcsC family protein [Methylococcus]|uniref:EcsC family protein n=1 Tax=Methylococcus capsulatus TaxID=414 RepID=A0ABZ2F3P9_METCP|nr:MULTISPECIES: EcsC family protein [Methylococcus]MDF9393746.1 EcsC family protein [Methylococcus capsulatus]
MKHLIPAVPPSRYEAEQIRAIAAWKRRKPHLASPILNRARRPLVRLSRKVLPVPASRFALDALNKMAEQLVRDDWILRHSGCRNLEEIGAQSLEFSDRLADKVIEEGLKLATGVGAMTGAGSMGTVLVGVPALLGVALRLIHRVSQAYGYSTERTGDRSLMLHILALATADTPEERARALDDHHWQLEHHLVGDAVNDAALAVLQRIVLGRNLASFVPGLSVALNAYANRSFSRRAGLAAKRVFQERWLLDHGRIADWLAPA